MTIEQNNSRTEGYFIAKDGDRELGRMYYTWAGVDNFVINHTEVNDDARGTGAGKFLVESAVKYARDNKFKIVPACQFANAMFKRNKEAWKDVVFD